MRNKSDSLGKVYPILLISILFALFFLFPVAGNRNWDGLMTASVLKTWHHCRCRHFFFFAHPLVIPLTKPFTFYPTQDMLFVGLLRETFFASLSALLFFSLLSSLLKNRAKAFLVSLSFSLTFSYWKLATLGEEKSITIFFQILFVLLFLQYRNIIDVKVLSPLTRRRVATLALGFLLFLAFAVHLQNVLLIPFVIGSTLLSRDTYTNWKEKGKEILAIFSWFALFSALFFTPILLHCNRIHTFKGTIYWFGEYHLNRENLKTHFSAGERLTEAYKGFRRYISPSSSIHEQNLLRERNITIFLFIVALLFSFLTDPPLTLHIFLYIALHGSHFFFYRPYEAEQWAGVAFWGTLLFANATLRNKGKLPLLLWILFLFFSLSSIAKYNATKLKKLKLTETLIKANTNSAESWIIQHFQSQMPHAILSREVDRRIEKDALLIVESRFWVNAFLLYTPRTPIALYYIGKTPEYLREHTGNTILSIHFYATKETRTSLRKALRRGKPVYFFTEHRDGVKFLRKRLGFQTILFRKIGTTNFRLYHIREP